VKKKKTLPEMKSRASKAAILLVIDLSPGTYLVFLSNGRITGIIGILLIASGISGEAPA